MLCHIYVDEINNNNSSVPTAGAAFSDTGSSSL